MLTTLKNKLLKLTAALVLALIPFIALSVEADEIYNELIDRYNGISSYKAAFRQQNFWSDSDISMESEGFIYLSAQQMALIYSDPVGQRLVIDDYVYIVDESEKNIIITELDQDFHFSPINVLKHYWQNSAVEVELSENNKAELSIYPNDDLYTAKIEVVISRDNMLIAMISYLDHQSNKVQFKFSDYSINIDIKQTVFTIPERDGYTIIDQRR